MKIKIVALLLAVFAGYSSNAHKENEVKKGILLVTFGTSYPEAQKVFKNIEKKVQQAYPEIPLRWAYTSKIIRKKLAKQGQIINSPAEALAKMGEEGFTHVTVQSLHVIPGEEYENLEKTVNAFQHMPKGVQKLTFGKPLLYSHSDNERLAAVFHNEFENKLSKKSAMVFMGHGTHHQANIYYPGFQYYLSELNKNYLVGTVEGFPELDKVIEKLKAQKIEKVILIPLMSVAGDHAQNDMAGSEEDSWKTILENEGFEVEIILKGMAEYDEVIAIWLNHLKSAFEEL